MDQFSLTLKASHASALATLVRLLGDLDLAEEALQEATVRALSAWHDSGIPEHPVAWLVQTGRRYAIDLIRRHNMEARHHQGMQASADSVETDERLFTEVEGLPFRDDLLKLIFTCCHPALAKEAQVALTLKTIAGLSVNEIARAFLIAPTSMEKRLTRAKQKIRQARIPYAVPKEADLPERLAAVQGVVYLIFNEAYTAAQGPDLMRLDLADIAIRLGRLLNRLFRSEAEVTGLLALMLLQHSRARARVDSDGVPIPMDQQDRALWDRELIAEGSVLVEKALRQGPPGPYQIQAAIAAVHCKAVSSEDTDWAQIIQLYELLEHYLPSPVICLNRAVAVSRVHGAHTALSILDEIGQQPEMQSYQYFHSTRASLLADIGEHSKARAAYEQALLLCQNTQEQQAIKDRIAALP